nr:twin-arginine translocase TatA/TatE family subunit [Breznakibacter xylanolyticus]
MLMNLFLISMPGGGEWVIIILIVLLLFGGRKIPELMKGLGQGLREFKKAKDSNPDETPETDKK